MPDYDKLRATATRLITGAGTACTLVKFDQTAAAPTQPWLGPTSPRGSGAANIIGAQAVFVPVTSSFLGLMTMDQALLKSSDGAVIIQPVDGVDLLEFNEIFVGAVGTENVPDSEPTTINIIGAGTEDVNGAYTALPDQVNGKTAWSNGTYTLEWSTVRAEWIIQSGDVVFYSDGVDFLPESAGWTEDTGAAPGPIAELVFPQQPVLPSGGRWKIVSMQALAPDGTAIMYAGVLKK